jgi:hypothetical protein
MWEPQKDLYYAARATRVAKYRIKFEGATQLSDIPGYVWFTPAALYLWGGFTDLQLAGATEAADIRMFWYKFERPIFTGFTVLGDGAWNHTLWAVEQRLWGKFVDNLLELVMLNRPGATVCRYALQQLSIVDPLRADNAVITSANPPRAVVFAFAVKSNLHQLAFTQLSWDAASLPGMKRLRPSAEEQTVAARLFAKGVPTTEQAFDAAKALQLESDAEAYAARRKRFKA